MSNMMSCYYIDVVSSENIYAYPIFGNGAPAIYADPAPGNGTPAIYADPALDTTITYIGLSEQSVTDVIFQI
jgi:hypothetical protein